MILGEARLNYLLIFFVLSALTFDFLNGFHDSANVVATSIASRAMSPPLALLMTALANFAGPFLFGVAVATTLGHEVLAAQAVTVPVAQAALLSAIAWNLLTWWLGIPSSSSHALVGGFVGAAITGYGLDVIRMSGLEKVVIGLFLSPILGLLFGWLIMRLMMFFGQWLTPRVNVFFRRAQWVTSLTLALSHGSNDAQKTMGLLTLGLVAFGVLPEFKVPIWVIAASAAAIGLGTVMGGWRLIHTIGYGFYRIRPVHAFSSQVAGTVIILGAALLGAPVSTTQVISSNVVGAGAAHRIPMVRWTLASQIVFAWLITIPATGVLGGLTWMVLKQFIG